MHVPVGPDGPWPALFVDFVVPSYIWRARRTWRGPGFGFCPPVRPRARVVASPSFRRTARSPG
jgi:hypothetical protein